MREIKFRAFAGQEMWEVTTFTPFWIEVKNGTTGARFDEGDYVLMQFTGLHDKNGKEIYEGDILHLQEKRYENLSDIAKQFATDENKAVTFDGAAFRFDGITLGDLIPSTYLSAEVIGNIYENPELLTV